MDNQISVDLLNAVLKLGAAAVPGAVCEESTEVRLVPDGYKLQAVEPIVAGFRENPLRIESTVTVKDAPSFLEYWKRYANDDSLIFADYDKRTVHGILDYHSVEGVASWCKHRISLQLETTREWDEWASADGQRMGQQAFAEFVENHLPSIASPPAATMLEIAREFQAKVDVDFASTAKIQNGNILLNYSEKTTASVGKGRIEVPEVFSLRMPALVGGQPVSIDARLRYRIKEGSLQLFYQLVRSHDVLDAAFDAAVSLLRVESGSTVIIGKP